MRSKNNYGIQFSLRLLPQALFGDFIFHNGLSKSRILFFVLLCFKISIVLIIFVLLCFVFRVLWWWKYNIACFEWVCIYKNMVHNYRVRRMGVYIQYNKYICVVCEKKNVATLPQACAIDDLQASNPKRVGVSGRFSSCFGCLLALNFDSGVCFVFLCDP